MTSREIASAVLGCVGGADNVIANSLCMTRLRITVGIPSKVKREALESIDGVLGTASRGANGIEVVFGPSIARSVYAAFSLLTGLDSDIEPLIGSRRPDSNFRVHITPGKRKSYAVQAVANGDGDDFEFDDLAELLEPSTDKDALGAPAPSKLLVLNGPNINMVGIREPSVYGTEDYPAILALCRSTAAEVGFAECTCYQSNHEGDLVDVIQDAYGTYDAIVINPGAYTHTSIALLDALKAVSIPTIEVHISKVSEREDFRQVSYVRLACIETVMGLGIEGYRVAIQHLAEHLGLS